MSSFDHADILRDRGAAVACPHSVLLVDDESVVLEVLSSALQRAGFRVGIARDANEALTRVRHADFDAALSDIRLPGVGLTRSGRGPRPARTNRSKMRGAGTASWPLHRLCSCSPTYQGASGLHAAKTISGGSIGLTADSAASE
jgi:CheY-like chemotaxis protein